MSQQQIYHEQQGAIGNVASQGFVAGRTVEPASFVFRRKDIVPGNQTGFGWELVYDSISASADQKLVFKEVAVVSFKTP